MTPPCCHRDAHHYMAAMQLNNAYVRLESSTSFWGHFSRIFLSDAPPGKCRVLCSTACPCRSHADWCLESDVMTKFGLQAVTTVRAISILEPDFGGANAQRTLTFIGWETDGRCGNHLREEISTWCCGGGGGGGGGGGQNLLTNTPISCSNAIQMLPSSLLSYRAPLKLFTATAGCSPRRHRVRARSSCLVTRSLPAMARAGTATSTSFLIVSSLIFSSTPHHTRRVICFT